MPYDCVLWGPNPLIESWDKLPLEVDGVNKEGNAALLWTNVRAMTCEIIESKIPLVEILFQLLYSLLCDNNLQDDKCLYLSISKCPLHSFNIQGDYRTEPINSCVCM